MKFKTKLLIDKSEAESSDLDIAEAVRSLSPLPRSSIQAEDSSTSDLDQGMSTKLPNSPSPLRSADEDSGVGGSPGSSSRSSTASHSCHMCNKKFSRADILRKHVKTHVNSSCTVCGQICNDKVALAKHQVEVHTLDRVFQCPQCEKGFKELRTLRLHLKIHNAEYPEQCGVCQKVFRTKWQLKQHQMDHGGERPYPCPECSFTCKTKQQLNEHRRKHSGEKAYSCAQCGTRFTYRNGLIKHTKLNRCPKKIITAEGETIIKKRSRTFNSSKPKDTHRMPESTVGSPAISLASPQATGAYGLTSPSLPSPISMQDNIGSNSQYQRQPSESSLMEHQPVNPTLFVQNQQIQLNGDTYGLAVLEDGSLVATPQIEPKLDQVSNRGFTSLSPQVIAALSAATGLPPQEICSWAANLPAGSTVRVTHHFDPVKSADSSARVSEHQPFSPSTGLSADGPARLNQLFSPLARLTADSSARVTQQQLFTAKTRQSLSRPANLTLEMANACHDSLISACVGLPSYQESFAVDPNEILSKDRCNKLLSPNSVVIKEEPPLTPNVVDNNFNNIVDDSLSGMISDDLGSYFNFPEVTKAPAPSVINVANSRLLNSHVIMSESANMIKQEPGLFNSHQISPMGLMDLDNIFPDGDAHADLDLVGFNLNDQDFTSIKTIVEQTFRDGRDVLDIISTV